MAADDEGSGEPMPGQCTTEQKALTGEEGSAMLRREPTTSVAPSRVREMAKPSSPETDEEDGDADEYYEYDDEDGEADEYDEEEEPEQETTKVAAPDPQKMQATIDRIVEETRLQDAVAAAAGKQRLPDNQVKFILALKREAFPSSDHENSMLSKYFSPERIEEKRKLDEEAAALCEKIQDDFEDFRKDVQQQWDTKGKVEFDNEYFKQRAEKELWMKREWAKMDFSRVVISKSRDH